MLLDTEAPERQPNEHMLLFHHFLPGCRVIFAAAGEGWGGSCKAICGQARRRLRMGYGRRVVGGGGVVGEGVMEGGVWERGGGRG